MATYDLRNSIPSADSIQTGDILNAPFDNRSFTVTLPKGTYTLEAWGGAGTNSDAGKGGYAKGTIALQSQTVAYLLPGNGTIISGRPTARINGGSRNGGDASDIRLFSNSINNRILVAGGGGNSGRYGSALRSGGAGGGSSGGDGAYIVPNDTIATGGSQTAGGVGGKANPSNPYYLEAIDGQDGTFGAGGYPDGGGGWYGGGGRFYRYEMTDPEAYMVYGCGAGGGSGFALTSSSVSNVPSGYASTLKNSAYYLTSTQLISGSASMPDPDGGTMTGSQVGYVRITVVSAVPPVPAPSNLTYSNLSANSVTLSWTASSLSGVSYKVYRGSTLLTTVTTTTYTDTGISPGQTYTYKVIAAKSGYADSSAVTLSVTNPSQLSSPTGLSATYTFSNTTLTWNAVSGANAYKVWRGSTYIGQQAGRSYTDSTAGATTTYTYKVSAVDTTNAKYESVQSSFSSSNTTALPAPTNLTYSNLSANSVTLSWTASTVYSTGVSYKVYRGTTLIKTTTSTTYTDSGISPGNTYTFKVVATKSGYTDSSAISVSITNQPQLAAPSGLSASYTTSATTITWNAVTNATKYKVWRGSTYIGEQTTRSYTDSTAGGKGTSNTYKVSAVANSGYYESTQASINTNNPSQLATPTGGTASYTTTSTTISWNAVTNATAYKIYRGSTLLTSTNSTTSYTDTSAGSGTTNTYKVSATANGYYESGQLSISTSNNPNLATPTGLSASYTVSSTTITWTPVANATAYKVWRGTTLLTSTLASTTYTDTSSNAGAGKSNTYKVSATASGYYESDQASITTTNKGQFSKPTGLSASYTKTSTTISWSKVTSPAAATVYNVWRGGTSLGTVTSSASTISITDTSALAISGKSYTYYVSAAETSSYYESARASIKSNNPPTLGTPANLAASYTKTQTKITWTAVTSATSYKIYKANILVATVTSATYTDTSATSGSGSITYKVVASNSPSYYDSNEATITTSNPSALSPVTNLSASQTVDSVTLTWTKPAGATRYTVQRGTDTPVTVSSTAGTVSYTDSTTLPGTTYVYNVVAKASGKYDSTAESITIAVKPRLSAPTLAEAFQTQTSVTLSSVRTSTIGTLVLSRDGSQIATYTPTGTTAWQYTDSGLESKRSYVYSVYTQGNSNYYDSLVATVTVYVGKDYTQIERQRSYMQMLSRPFFKLCRLRFLYPNGATAFALDNNPRNRRSKAFIQGGTVNANMQNGQRLTASVTIANANHEFDFALNHIWFGQDIALDEGLVLQNGDEYWRQTGVFVIDNPTETINPNTRTVTYNLVDKWADLDGTLDGNLEGTYEVAVNTNIYTPIAALLSEDRGNGRVVDNKAPVFTEYFNSRTQNLPDGTVASMVLSPYTLTIDGDGGTIGAVVLGLGGMVNAWVGYDNTGRLRIEPSQDDILDAQKAVLYRFSPEQVTLLGLAYTIKKEDLFNDYIVVGEQLDNYSQPGGRAENLDPRSDTNIKIIGRKTKRESASGYATVQQCKDLAEWRLKRAGVLQKAVNISCSQMFHIELNSLVEIVRTDKEGSPTERHLIQGYSRPLATNGQMTITAVSTVDFPIATVTEWPTA